MAQPAFLNSDYNYDWEAFRRVIDARARQSKTAAENSHNGSMSQMRALIQSDAYRTVLHDLDVFTKSRIGA